MGLPVSLTGAWGRDGVEMRGRGVEQEEDVEMAWGVFFQMWILITWLTSELNEGTLYSPLLNRVPVLQIPNRSK
jgi:hypothetical protein